jgi:hypothetical protein
VLTAPALGKVCCRPGTAADQHAHNSSGSVDGSGAELCRFGDSGQPAMVVCRSLRKDGDGSR